MEKANLVIISFDQWRGDWGDVYNPVIDLPTLSEIASDGITLQRCYTNSPQCVPARFSWLTGLEPSQLGVTKNADISLPINAPSIIRQLQKKGWTTSIVGKTHWSSHNKKRDIRESEYLIKGLGFDQVIEVPGPRALKIINCELTDDWESEGWLSKQRKDLEKRYDNKKFDEAWKSRKSVLPNHLYPDIWIRKKSEIQIDNLPTTRPWILWISFVGPHEPFDTPEPWRGSTNKEILPKPIKRRDWIENLKDNCQLKLMADKWRGKITNEQKEALRCDYAEHLILLDDQVKLILEKIKKRSDFKKTGIVITADHGEMLGDGDMLYKSTFIESAIRVPMIYRPPKGVTHKKYSNPVNTTGFLSLVIDNLENGGEIEHINAWLRSQKGAIAEYGTERIFVKRNKKLCMNFEGEILWATNIEKDPEELINIAATKNVINSRGWKNIIKWSNKITKERMKSDWIWQNLIKYKFDQI